MVSKDDDFPARGSRRERRRPTLTNRVESLEKIMYSFKDQFYPLDRREATNAASLHDFIWKVSIGIDQKDAKVKRFVPIRVYIKSDGYPIDPYYLATLASEFVQTGEFEPVFELQAEWGSWKQVRGALSRWWGTADDAANRLTQMEQAAKSVLLDKPTAEVAKLHADAAAALIDKVKDYDGASIQYGNMMLVKNTTSDGRKLLLSGPLSLSALQTLEKDHLEQMKPENAQKLLEQSGQATVVDQDTLRLPSPRTETDDSP